jgi:hypothetical protein
MNSNLAAMKDGQAPARRFGAIIAILVTCIGCACLTGVWYAFARESLDSLVTSVKLQASGVRTTATVTDVEKFTGGKASFPSTNYRLIVTFDVDGKTYTLQSNALYAPLDHTWVGETMPVIYDPTNPDRALIDTFKERWLEPITNSVP